MKLTAHSEMSGTSELRVLHLDHTAVPGGGQLGLTRFIENAPRGVHAVAFLTGGAMVDRIERTGTPVQTRLPDAAFLARRDLSTSQRWLRQVVASFSPYVILAKSEATAKAFAPILLFTTAMALYYMRSSPSTTSNDRFTSLVMDSLLHRHLDAFLANSTWARDNRSLHLQGHPMEVAYPVSGVTNDAGATADRPLEHDERGNRIFRIVSLGQFEPGKGHIQPLQAANPTQKALEAKQISSTVDLFGGDVLGNKEYSRELHGFAQGVTPKVSFHGHVPDVNSHLDRSNCLVLSSDEPKPSCQMIVQAMSRGALTIVPNEGGPSDEITPDIDGLTYPLRDAAVLAERLGGAVSDKEHATWDRPSWSRTFTGLHRHIDGRTNHARHRGPPPGTTPPTVTHPTHKRAPLEPLSRW